VARAVSRKIGDEFFPELLVYIIVFCDMSSCSLVGSADALEEPAAFFFKVDFYPEDRHSASLSLEPQI
jgi:hypothetical protein